MNKSAEVTKDTLVKIAYWYYKKNMTQDEIAKRLAMTRQKVNKIIGSLVDLGIVEIQINGLAEDFTELEYLIEKHFNLTCVSIINSDDFFSKAAERLNSFFENNQTIGLSWGETLGATVNMINHRRLKNSNVIQLAGGMNSKSTFVRPDEITRVLATKLGSKFHLLYAPAFVHSIELKEAIINEESVKTTFNYMKGCDLAILGVGNLRAESTLGKEGFIPTDLLNDMLAEGCVGDVAMLPFKKDGTWYETGNIIGIDVETLKNIPNVVILAKGAAKTEAVIGAINTGCINTIIIDKYIAQNIADEFKLEK